ERNRGTPENAAFLVIWATRYSGMDPNNAGLPGPPELVRNYHYSWETCIDSNDGTPIPDGHVAFSTPVSITTYSLNTLLVAINATAPLGTYVRRLWGAMTAIQRVSANRIDGIVNDPANFKRNTKAILAPLNQVEIRND